MSDPNVNPINGLPWRWQCICTNRSSSIGDPESCGNCTQKNRWARIAVVEPAPPAGGEVRITDPTTGGAKGQKPERWDLFPFDALDEVARVYGRGAEKYPSGEDGVPNWLKGYRWSLSLGALLRHVSRIMMGEDVDPETGRLHAAHAAWHCLLLVTYKLRGLGTDDRAALRGGQ